MCVYKFINSRSFYMSSCKPIGFACFKKVFIDANLFSVFM